MAMNHRALCHEPLAISYLEPLYFLLEAASPLGVVAEHVEARARRREQNDSRRLRERVRAPDRRVERVLFVNDDGIGERIAEERARFAYRDGRLRTRTQGLPQEPEIP